MFSQEQWDEILFIFPTENTLYDNFEISKTTYCIILV